MTDSFATLPLAALTASPTNPRRHFDAEKLADLASSIAASGVHQPILVRPLPASRMHDTFTSRLPGEPLATHEIVAGERRFRASKLAGLAAIPALIREMTDDQVLEAQLVENLQRADLSELEEAEGYETLMQHADLNADEVAAKIGKSRSYVYGRLKLLDLGQAAKQALREGQIDNTRALLIARIHDTQLQEKALAEATAKTGQGELVHTTRGLTTWLHQNVMLPLDRAPFVITDACLVESAGSCKECPKRTGAAPDIFRDVLGADICTDPPCYHRKTDAHVGHLQTKADALGATLVHGKEAAVLCTATSDILQGGYSPLTQERRDTKSGQPATLAQLLAKGGDMPSTLLIENPHTRALVHAVNTAEAETVLLARGLIKAADAVAGKGKAKAGKDDLEQRTKNLLTDIARASDRAYRQAASDALHNRVHFMEDNVLESLLSPKLIRAWLTTLLDMVQGKTVAKAMNFALPEKAKTTSQQDDMLKLHIQAMDKTELEKAFVLLLTEGDDGTGYVDPANHGKAPTYEALAERLEMDLSILRDEASIKVKALHADELKALQAEASAKHKTAKASAKNPAKASAKKPTGEAAQGDLPLAPAAQASGARGGKGKKTEAPAGARARVAKLSAEEAQLGIAAAMQGMGEEGAPAAGRDAESYPDGFAVGDVRPSAETATPAQGQSGGASAAETNDSGHSEAGVDQPAPETKRGQIKRSDALLEDACDLVREEGACTVRLVKERQGVGTTRALRIISELERDGVVSACDERGARVVLGGDAAGVVA